MAAQYIGGQKLMLPGGPDLHEFALRDLYELSESGLIRITGYGTHGDLRFHVTNAGFEYIGQAVADAPGPVLVERAMNLVRSDLPQPYRTAQSLIEEAAKKPYVAKTEHDLSEVGHKCREAMQEFAIALYEQWVPAAQRQDLSKDKTKNRVGHVLTSWREGVGESTVKTLDALYEYWSKVVDHVQKVEHRSQKEARRLTQDDARRAVLYTYLVMAELVEVGPRE